VWEKEKRNRKSIGDLFIYFLFFFYEPVSGTLVDLLADEK
jgi:hypothetical protein